MMEKRGSVLPVLGALGMVVTLTAAWLAIRPNDTRGLPVPDVFQQPEARTVPLPESAPPVAEPLATPDAEPAAGIDDEAVAALQLQTDIVAGKMDMERQRTIALARLGPEFRDEVNTRYAAARAELDALPARAAAGELTTEQTYEQAERIRREFKDAMVAALPPEVLDRMGRGDGGREEP